MLIQPGVRDARQDPVGSDSEVVGGAQVGEQWGVGQRVLQLFGKIGQGCHSSVFFTKELENPGLLHFAKPQLTFNLTGQDN